MNTNKKIVGKAVIHKTLGQGVITGLDGCNLYAKFSDMKI